MGKSKRDQSARLFAAYLQYKESAGRGEGLRQERPAHSSCCSSTSASSSLGAVDLPADPPGSAVNTRIPCNSNRMQVTLPDGRRYSCDRFCPHSAADLLGAPLIISGTILQCPKHKWLFDLTAGGKCIRGDPRTTLNARPLLDW